MKYIFFIVALPLFMISCSQSIYVEKPVSKGDIYYFHATYYGDGFDGKKSASGEVFNKNEFTCAVNSFPFNTLLEITNLENDKKVVVRVNDRPGKMVLDLSEKSFMKIAAKKNGRIKVRVKVIGKVIDKSDEKISKESSSKAKKEFFYTIQLAAFHSLEAADRFKDGVDVEGVYIYFEQGERDIYRVRVGKFDTKDAAIEYKNKNFKNIKVIIFEVAN